MTYLDPRFLQMVNQPGNVDLGVQLVRHALARFAHTARRLVLGALHKRSLAGEVLFMVDHAAR